jgi:hypothetical protein
MLTSYIKKMNFTSVRIVQVQLVSRTTTDSTNGRIKTCQIKVTEITAVEVAKKDHFGPDRK